MKTEIFNSYSEFLKRKDKEINGVSKIFSKLHPDFIKENESNKGCWNCSHCSSCSDCSSCYGCYGCSSCSSCSHCSSCSDCSHCSRCSDCSSCYGCRCVSGVDSLPVIPAISNIHAKVYDATLNKGALDMSDWHICKTTHCRAGWVVHLAGKGGYELETKTSTLFAAMQIYKSSSVIEVSPTRFFEPNEIAIADIKRCAQLELSLNKQ